jgi:hypothetical protein
MSTKPDKIEKPIDLLRQAAEQGINLAVDTMRKYLENYDLKKEIKRRNWKTIIVILLSNLGTLVASALGLG